MAQFSNYWKIITPASRKQLYTTISTDAYDPRTTDLSSMTTVTWYSQIMRGPGSRMNQYKQYDAMDADVDISRALDTIAEEMSNKDEKTKLPFIIEYDKEDNQDVSDTTAITLRQAVRQWSQLQDLNVRLFGVSRALIKYGDCFFRKNSDTKKWVWIDPSLVYGIEIDQLGNKINYHLKKPGKPHSSTAYGTKNEEIEIIPAAAMLHFTMSDEMGDSTPFGQSVLRPVFRVYRQLSMIEDAVIIYRIVRAPERRVFYVDVGNMPAQRVKQYLEQVKNEIRQKRVPGMTNNGQKDVVDGQYDPQCLALDTRIPLLDGRTLSLQELIEEYKLGKQNWVYSCDPVTGAIKPGEISWAGVTRKNAEIVKITLDNGSVITCTPDHKFPVQGIGFVRADELDSTMSLVPLNRRWKSCSVTSEEPFHQGYEEIFDVSKKQWVKTHKVVASSIHLQEFTYKSNEKKVVVHHVDFNKLNNSPDNLVMMGVNDHIQYHADYNAQRFSNWSEQQQQRQISSLNEGATRAWKNNVQKSLDDQERRVKSRSLTMRARGIAPVDFSMKNRAQNIAQQLTISPQMVARVIDILKENHSLLRKDALTVFSQDEILMSLYAQVNVPSKSGRRTSISHKFLNRLIRENGFSGFTHMRSYAQQLNHKIVSIETMLQKQDTGCISIGEKVHNWHTFALESGVFVKNSIQEDMFFPVTATGRGSRVETLPGGTEDFGTNLLKYFRDKLFRGLRVPSSYMVGQDGQGAQYNDGKVGIAYIEELRFANFIRRLQDRMEGLFDEQFKIYLKVCGLKIDDEIFRLRLPDPANFALYRQAALDADLISSFNNISGERTLSKRFILKRYLGLTDDEIQMNEVMVKEERGILENTNIPSLQQIYDPAVYENREQLSVEPPGGGIPGEDALAGGLGGEEDIGGFFGGTGGGAEPPSMGGETPPAPTETPPAPTGTPPAV